MKLLKIKRKTEHSWKFYMDTLKHIRICITTVSLCFLEIKIKELFRYEKQFISIPEGLHMKKEFKLIEL